MLVISMAKLKHFKLRTTVVCGIESLDGTSRLTFTAFTVEKVTGDMKAMDWITCAREWPHLQHLEFPKLVPHLTVIILIGLDCADLLYSVRDIRGAPGQPCNSMVDTIRMDVCWCGREWYAC